MNTVENVNPEIFCAPRPRKNLGMRLSEFWAYLKFKNQQYRDLKHLSEMTDDQLRDIGLHRADIQAAVYGPSQHQIRNEDLVRR